MSVIDDYLKTLPGSSRQVITQMYSAARDMVPDATEEMSYAMPSLKYRGKGLIAIMANKDFLSLYPFGAVKKLDLDLTAFECTSGSIHFSADKPIPDKLLRQIITIRKRQINESRKA